MRIPGPAGVVDPHIHQWNPYVTRRHSWLAARVLRPVPRIPRALGWLVSQSDREFIGDPHHALKPYLPANYAVDAGPVPVSQVVHIEADWPMRTHLEAVDETRWIAGLPFGVGGAPALGAIVVHADLRRPDAGTVLDAHLAASPLVRGVRFKGAHHPDPGVKNFCDEPDVFTSPVFLDGFSAVAERGLGFEIWCYAHQLTGVRKLVGAYPETTFVLNHYGTPVGLFGPRGRHAGRSARERAQQLAVWRDDLAAVAEHRNVVAKHSGLGMPLLGDVPQRARNETSAGELMDRAAPLVWHLHSCFGADRTMWASNYPIDKPGLTLPATISIITEMLGSDADLPELLGGVARRAYHLTSGREQV